MSATGDGNPATGDGNPATGNENPTPGGLESPVGVAREQVWVAEADLMVMGDSRPHGGDVAGAARVTGAAGVLGQEAGEQVAGLAGVVEAGSDEEDSDIELAEEGEEVAAGGQGLVVDAYQFPMVGFRFMFLDLVHTLLYRIYYNGHIVVRPSSGSMVRRQRAMSQVAAGVPALRASQSSVHRAVAQEPEDQPEAEAEEESATWETAEEAEEEPEQAATAPECVQEAAAQEETTKYQYEDSEEDAQDAENTEEEEKFNKKQGPEKDVDPAEGRL